MDLNISFLPPVTRIQMQHAIDAVNSVAAWAYVETGALVRAQHENDPHPTAAMIFQAMGSKEPWIINEVTELAKNFDVWRDQCLVAALTHAKNELNNFLFEEYQQKFADVQFWGEGRTKVLDSLPYSHLATHVLSEEGRYALQYILGMDNVSYFGNEVLLDMIEENLMRL
jgi:hypothetical protein